MKQSLKMAGSIAAILMTLVVTGCAPKGGTVILINESSYTLTGAYISLGDSNVERLVPGQWMKASVEKNVSANVKFTLTDGKDLVISNKGEGSWFISRWTSPLITVHDGDSVTVTIRNKIE